MTDAQPTASSVVATGRTVATTIKSAPVESRRRSTWAALALLGCTLQPAQAQVVADSACPYYAADIESFATCDGDRVAVYVAPRAMPVGAASANSGAAERLAASALYVMWLPLLDEKRPSALASPNDPRWCGPNTRLLVEGRPLEAGRVMQEGGRALNWTLDDCRPIGITDLHLSGSVRMHLVRDDEYGVTAIVQPQDLRVTSRGVTETLTEPFVAALSRP